MQSVSLLQRPAFVPAKSAFWKGGFAAEIVGYIDPTLEGHVSSATISFKVAQG